MACAREPRDRRRRVWCADRGVWCGRDRSLVLRDQGHGWNRAAAEARRVRDRAGHHRRNGDRARGGVRPAGARHRRGPLRLGPAVDRDHDRPAAAVARPPRAHPPLPAGWLAVDHRAADPRRHDVRHAAGRHHRHHRRRTSAWNRPCWLPRPCGVRSRAARPRPARSAPRRSREHGRERGSTTCGVRGRAGRACTERPLGRAGSGGTGRIAAPAPAARSTGSTGGRPMRPTPKPPTTQPRAQRSSTSA